MVLSQHCSLMGLSVGQAIGSCRREGGLPHQSEQYQAARSPSPGGVCRDATLKPRGTAADRVYDSAPYTAATRE